MRIKKVRTPVAEGDELIAVGFKLRRNLYKEFCKAVIDSDKTRVAVVEEMMRSYLDALPKDKGEGK